MLHYHFWSTEVVIAPWPERGRPSGKKPVLVATTITKPVAPAFARRPSECQSRLRHASIATSPTMATMPHRCRQ
jgi:hypothetical protein